MKKLIPALVAIVILSNANFKANAQNGQNSIAKLNATIAKQTNTYEVNNFINAAYKSSSSLSKASSRALKDFSKTYKSVANATWYDDGEGGFIAYFKDSISNTHVDYNRKGNWVYSISSYSEQQLPSYISFGVKFAYPTSTINSVQEIHYQGKMVYLLYTEDKKTYKTLRYTDEDGTEEIEELHKQ